MRFRRRVSPTSLTSPLLRSPTRPLSSLSDISPALHFPYPRITGLTLSTLLPCCSRPYSFPRASNPFNQFHFQQSAIPQSPFFSLPSPPTPSPPHFYRCSPTALPAGFIREAKCARDSYSLRKRARERERGREERGLFFSKAETRTVRVL